MWIKAKTSTTTFYLIKIICLVGQYFLRISSTFNHWIHASPDFEVQGPQECLSFCICIESLQVIVSARSSACDWMILEQYKSIWIWAWAVSQWSYPTLIPCSICRIGLVIGAGDCHHRYLLCNAIYLPFHYFSICTYGHILSECAFNLLTVVNSNASYMEMSKWSLNGCIQKIWCGCNDVWLENVYGF